MASGYEAVIGLEVHAQLLTRTKLFCGCATSFGDAPNTHVCPVCLGLPGALPVMNAEAARLAVRVAVALGLDVHEESTFERKNYFYPDLPKGYQISQYARPFSTSGHLELETAQGTKRAVIQRVHLEEDAGKSVHGAGGESIVDLNRAGTPLVEIVGEPDLRSPEEASAYLRALRDVLMFVGANDGNLEEGSFRCDANVSVRRPGEPLGTRCEIKNVNSFRFVERAIAFEIARQIELVETGRRVVQETRGWNERDETTYSLRSMEEAHDYRYFPDPDLPPLVLSRELVDRERAALPELPRVKRARYQALGLTPYDAKVLTAHPAIAAWFDDASSAYGGDAKRLANFVQTEALSGVTLRGLGAELPASSTQLADLMKLVDAGTISGKQAKEVYAAIAGTARAPAEIVAERGMAVVSDEAELTRLCERVLADNAKSVESYRAGKTGLFGFFVGAVMKATRGSANPEIVNRVLKRLLG